MPLPESWQRNRKCSRLGGSATSTSPVIRGSSTIASPESKSHDDPLADAADVANRRGPRRGDGNDRSAARSRSARRRQATRSTSSIRAPTTPRMPRRIVSTSGSSGMVNSPQRHREHGDISDRQLRRISFDRAILYNRCEFASLCPLCLRGESLPALILMHRLSRINARSSNHR